LSYPACAVDEFTNHAYRELARANAELTGRVDEGKVALDRVTSDLIRWRAAALGAWGVAASGTAPTGSAQAELEAMRKTVSWRVTKPIRTVRRAVGTRRRP
jgi:hypothetical protein